MDDFFKEFENDDIFSNFSETPNKKENEISPEKLRDEKVKKFVLNIEDLPGDDEKTVDNSNRPRNNGGVYFANYQNGVRRNPAPKTPVGGNDEDVKIHKPSQPTSAQRQQRPRNTGYNLDMFKEEERKPAPPQKPSKVPTFEKKKTSKEELLKMRKDFSKKFYIAVLFVAIFTIFLSSLAINCINDVLALSTDDEEIEVTFANDITLDEALDTLKDNRLIKEKWFCKMFSSFRDYEEKGKYDFYGKLMPYVGGTYYMSKSMGIEGMLNTLIGASNASEETVTLSFPEGWTIAQMVERLKDYEVISEENRFIKAMNYDYNYKFLLDKEKKDCYLDLEGYLFPDTYEFYVGESTTSVVKRFLDNFNDKWKSKYTKRCKEIGYSVNEVLTVASIVQKEAAGQGQMADIASVIYNRLERSVDYPMIQCDSTKNYVTIYLRDLIGSKKADKYLENYDTSICIGLPSGPICNPGMDAILAALYPSDTNYLYFCHDKNGNVYYAKNDLEHQRNVSNLGG